MSGPFKRRPSLRRPSMPGGLRRSSTSNLIAGAPAAKEVPWDLLDRCLLPVIFCHASAVIISTFLNVTTISQVSAFSLFIWFTITTIAAVLFYHNLKVCAAGKAVLITGCDNRAASWTARYLDELGFTVFAGFQRADDCPLAHELREQCSGRLHVLQLDISSEPQVLAASLYAVEHLPDGAPGLWALLNCASHPALGELEWLPQQVAKRAIEVNVLGTARITQVMLPLIRRARGRVVYVTSALAGVTSPVRGLHCATLAAIEALANCLRLELRPRGVDAIVVAPGEMSTTASWITDEELVKQARDMWLTLGIEQREHYGKEYFERAIRSLEKYTKTPEVELSAVSRSLCDAVIRTFPLPRYTPVTRQEKLQAFVADHLPRSVYDILYSS